MAALSAVAGGALLLAWPAFLNGYPLLFSDTGAFLHQTLGPLMIWDKPWVYGPLIHLFHWRWSLWLPLLAQCLALSHLLWLAQRAVANRATPARHAGLVAGVALLTAAPWSAALLMPDILAPVAVLSLFLLAFARDVLGPREAAWVYALAALAIAAHLSHLPVAAALVALAVVLARRARPALRAAAPLAAAVLVLLYTNSVGHGRASLSPHGGTFLLARLVANGSAARTVAARCPGSGWYLCAWAGRLPADSDEFLWRPDSPVNRDAGGAPRFLGGALLSAEAGEIVAETLRRKPGRVAADALRDAAVQLVAVAVGDTLPREALGATLRERIAGGFPAREVAAFDGSAQARGLLPGRAAPFLATHAPVLVLGAGLLAWCLRREWRAPRRLRFGLCVLAGVAANAFATGALSGPHDRYGARVAWLVPFAAALLLLPPARPREGAA